ncbi:MAG: hypothetical protein PHX27_01360 [Candidatus ainarchaeum sp.]|nr:hypothetical protein [Candidatus ainarchaeum sp.]
MQNNNAQSTVEYLIIIAIIIVIGLIVAGISTNMFQTQQITQTTQQLKGQIGTGGISITDATGNSNTKETYFNLKNTSGETLTITKIKTNDGENTYKNQPWIAGNTNTIKTTGLCECEKGQTQKTCNLKIITKTKNEITHTIEQTITIQCEQNVTPTNPQQIIQPEYTFTDTNCFDASKPIIPICTLSDLNRMRENLEKNYELLYDIDATKTNTYNEGKGWEPIGTTTSNPFKGMFNGNNKTIKNIFINKSDLNPTGFFGVVIPPTIIENIHFQNVNINGGEYTGGLIGSMYAEFYDWTGKSLVNNVSLTGTIKGSTCIGGLIGSSSGDINNSYAEVTISGRGNYKGGLVGAFLSPGSINNSFAKINLMSLGSRSGGLVGSSSGTINNSYAIGKVTKISNSGGLIGWLYYGETYNSYAAIEFIDADKTNNGGLISFYASGGITQNSYWDINLSKYETSYQGIGKTTIDMKKTSTFENWDFENIWAISPSKNGGYPYLQWEDQYK